MLSLTSSKSLVPTTSTQQRVGKNKPTALQQKNLDDIASTEGIALLINEANMKDVAYLLGARANNPDQLEMEF